MKEEIPTLWGDLKEFINNPKQKEYFFSSPVVYRTNDDNDDSLVNEVGIIDGQQRTITIAILAKVFRDICLTIEYQNGVMKAQQMYSVEDQDGNVVSRIKSDMKQDKDEIRKLFANSGIQDASYGTKSNDHRVSKCYRYFFDETTKEIEELTEQEKRAYLNKFLVNLKQKCFIGVTTCSDLATAIEVYMKMNSRGKNLHPSDLIKAELFLRHTNFSNSTDDVSEKWTDLAQGKEASKISELLHDYLATKRGQISTRLYSDYRDVIQKFDSANEVIEHMEVLTEFKHHYFKWNNSGRIAPFSDLVRCKVRYASNLLAFCDLYGASADYIKSIEKILDAVYAIHFTFERDSNILKRKMVKCAHELFKRQEAGSVNWDHYYEYLLGELKDYFVNREEFVNRLAQLQLDQNNEAQFFLRRIERFYSPEGKEINKPKFVNTEHIYPQTPGSNWDPLRTPANGLRIGNLTLCDSDFNKKLGNKKWEEKVRIWKERDPAKVYKLVNHIEDNGPGIDFDLEQWGDAQIEKRSKRLSELVFDILLQPVYELML